MASAKEPRRSNRRSVHSSTSKSSGSPSPDAAPLPLHTKEPDANSSARSAASSSSNSTAARAKRAKDDNDEKIGAPSSGHRRTTSIASTANVHAAHPAPTPKRTKRRGKENIAKAEDVIEVISEGASNTEVLVAGEDVPEEDAGITRCVCEGLADDDGDAAEFMVQCELCMAWQHGPCMGFAQESELPPGDYYCEQCKPENHVELLKKLQRRQRQSSEKSLHNSHQSRNSRSHSPSYLLKTSKRRNTMNSRDAAYEESIQKLLDATAAEAGPGGDNTIKDRAESIAKTDDVFEDADFGPGARKKRKRAEDEITTAKRKRSSSILSERVVTVAAAADKPEATTPITSALLPPPPAPVNGKSRVRRAGGRKNAAAQDASVVGEGDEGAAAAKKHPNQYTYRGKSSVNTQNRRGPQSASGQNQQNPTTHDHGTRRNANNAGNLGGASGSGTRNAHNAYYNNMQLPMFTTWGLPDYLAHLQSILPSEVPPPLQIRGATSFFREDASTSSPGAGEAPSLSLQTSESADAQMANAMANATESLTERGVKVKWPAKRMSVADMNKRVRALVEWVGREQALALDRERRKAALENALAARQAHAPTDGVVASADRQRSPEPGANIAFAQTEGAAFIESPDHEKSASASAVNPDLGARAANGAPEQPVSASVSVSANANGSVDLRTLSALGFGFGFDESANARPSTSRRR